jgi:hypothetical protein
MRVKADPRVLLFWTNHSLLVTVACFIINVLACTYVVDPSQSVIQALPIFLQWRISEQQYPVLIYGWCNHLSRIDFVSATPRESDLPLSIQFLEEFYLAIQSKMMGGKGPRSIAVMWLMTSLSLILVILRLYTRIFVVKAVGIDDHVFNLAWVC